MKKENRPKHNTQKDQTKDVGVSNNRYLERLVLCALFGFCELCFVLFSATFSPEILFQVFRSQ